MSDYLLEEALRRVAQTNVEGDRVTINQALEEMKDEGLINTSDTQASLERELKAEGYE